VSQGPVDGLGGLAGAGCPGADRRTEVGGQVGVVVLGDRGLQVDGSGTVLAEGGGQQAQVVVHGSGIPDLAPGQVRKA